MSRAPRVRPAPTGAGAGHGARHRRSRRLTRTVAAVVGVALLAACSVSVDGAPRRAGGSVGGDAPMTSSPATTALEPPPDKPTSTSPTRSAPTASAAGAPQSWSPPVPGADVPDSEVGLRPDAPLGTVTIVGRGDGRVDTIAAAALADLFDYYTSIFPSDFDRPFVRPAHLVSYDSTEREGRVCDIDTYEFANAFYAPECDTVAWDRAVLMPEMMRQIGVLAPAVVLSHEIGHDVQDQLGEPATTPTLVLEQQADCYAGAYWRWVADGHSRFFRFNSREGMRQLLLSLFQAHDPPVTPDDTSTGDNDSHGNGFDRTYATSLGYSSGAVRCSRIDEREMTARGQEFSFDDIPYQYGNVDITDSVLRAILETVDEYFLQTQPGYVPPTLTTFEGATPPPCAGYGSSYPVTYCPPSNTVSYRLEALQRIGTPTAGWDSANGDFSAIVLLVVRYALAAQYAGHSPVTGPAAGLQALCYAGTWARWMRTPHGDYRLSPNDLDKAIYQIVSSPVAGSDVSGQHAASIIDRVEAFGFGVTHQIPDCFAAYAR